MSLGRIQSFVGAAQESLAVQYLLFTLLRGSESEAESNGNLARTRFDGLIGDAAAQTFCAGEQTFHITAGKDDQELFSAIAADGVVRPNVRSQAARHLLQDGVAHRVTVGVINFLKVIDVAHDHAERVRGAPPARYFYLQQVEDGAAIPKAGEPVVGRRKLQRILGMNERR